MSIKRLYDELAVVMYTMVRNGLRFSAMKMPHDPTISFEHFDAFLLKIPLLKNPPRGENLFLTK